MDNLDQLITQFQQKDIKAYEKLYTMYSKSISGVVNTIVKNDDVAQEITQDVFIRLGINLIPTRQKKVVFSRGY
jgi:DNA-directed RNA polymerase specialized sigma24 family protein